MPVFFQSSKSFSKEKVNQNQIWWIFWLIDIFLLLNSITMDDAHIIMQNRFIFFIVKQLWCIFGWFFSTIPSIFDLFLVLIPSNSRLIPNYEAHHEHDVRIPTITYVKRDLFIVKDNKSLSERNLLGRVSRPKYPPKSISAAISLRSIWRHSSTTSHLDEEVEGLPKSKHIVSKFSNVY